MGKRHKPRSLLKKPDHIPSPRTLLYRYLNADQKSKPQHLALIHDQKKYYNCYSLADFAYLAMTNRQLPEDCYREHREKNGRLNIFYGGVVNDDRVSNYGHMVITIEKAKKNSRKKRMIIEFNRSPGDNWLKQKVWVMGKKERNRLSKTSAQTESSLD